MPGPSVPLATNVRPKPRHRPRLRPTPPHPWRLNSALLPSPFPAPQFNPTMPLPVSEGLAAEIDRGISKAQLAILNLERYVALLNLCSLAANAGQTDSDMARAQESLAQEQRRVTEAQAAGDESARQQAEVGGWVGM